jgi:hypothetical protein
MSSLILEPSYVFQAWVIKYIIVWYYISIPMGLLNYHFM